ncbi:hypothetical protein [Nocardioides sp.]|uniref:hypothetical protein n=1 Tax=Nocardioides sp. TaxID=35761 RepID=UPI00263805B4|nr:hypothetical protein [Nocardioides sp.]
MDRPALTEQPPATRRGTSRALRWLQTERGVVVSAIAMILVALVIRSWAVSGSWFAFDDFVFMSWAQTDGLHLSSLMRNYGGHVMPAGIALSWLNLKIAGLGFWLTAIELIAGLALTYGGALMLLITAFGKRPGILPPLALLLFTTFTMPTTVWWAVGMNQTPGLIVIMWAGIFHLRYLRSRRFRDALIAIAITVVGLAFQEKTLFVYWLFALLAVGYFAQGDIVARLQQVWRRYRAGVVLYGVVAVGYLAIYLSTGSAFSPSPDQDQPLTAVGSRMIGTTYATGILGGPLKWDMTGGTWPSAAPPPLLTWVASGLVLLFLVHVAQTRHRSRRAWLLVAVPLIADIVLVTAGRSVLGSILALEYRYVTELAAFTMIALALATMPLLGAPEQVESTRESALLDKPVRVTLAISVIAVLGTVSCVEYAHRWHEVSQQGGNRYVRAVARTLDHLTEPTAIADTQVPQTVMWAYGYPDNTVSHVFRWKAAKHVTFPTIKADTIAVFDDTGHLGPMMVTPLRQAAPVATTGNGVESGATSAGCAYPAKHGAVSVPLDGPMLGTGWWTRAAYYAETETPMSITAGDQHYETTLEPGLHSLFFIAGADRMDEISFSGISAGAHLCIAELSVGTPTPAP